MNIIYLIKFFFLLDNKYPSAVQIYWTQIYKLSREFIMKKTKTYMDRLMENKEFRENFDKVKKLKEFNTINIFHFIFFSPLFII